MTPCAACLGCTDQIQQTICSANSAYAQSIVLASCRGRRSWPGPPQHPGRAWLAGAWLQTPLSAPLTLLTASFSQGTNAMTGPARSPSHPCCHRAKSGPLLSAAPVSSMMHQSMLLSAAPVSAVVCCTSQLCAEPGTIHQVHPQCQALKTQATHALLPM